MRRNNNNKPAQQPAPVNPDGVLDLLTRALKKNKEIILGVVAAVVLAAAGWAVWEHIEHKMYQAQWGNLFLVELDFMNNEDRSLQPLEDFAAQNRATDAGVQAAFMLGNAYYQLKDFVKAAFYFKQAVENANKYMAPLAEVSLIATQIASTDYQGAITQADSFAAKYPAHFAMGQVKHYKALAQELSGKTAAAKESYAVIEQDYPNTYYAAFAQQRLGALK